MKREFEPIELIGMPTPPEVNVVEVPEVVPVPGGDIIHMKPETIVSIEQPVNVDDTTSLRRVGDKYVAPPIATIGNKPITLVDPVGETAPSGFKVTSGTPYADEPMDETVDDLPKVFGRKAKEPVSVNGY